MDFLFFHITIGPLSFFTICLIDGISPQVIVFYSSEIFPPCETLASSSSDFLPASLSSGGTQDSFFLGGGGFSVS